MLVLLLLVTPVEISIWVICLFMERTFENSSVFQHIRKNGPF
jgi:hypothetical protein